MPQPAERIAAHLPRSGRAAARQQHELGCWSMWHARRVVLWHELCADGSRIIGFPRLLGVQGALACRACGPARCIRRRVVPVADAHSLAATWAPPLGGSSIVGARCAKQRRLNAPACVGCAPAGVGCDQCVAQRADRAERAERVECTSAPKDE